MGAVVPTVQAFEALLHPDDRNGTLEAIERALNEGAPYDRVYRIVRPDGAVRDIHTLGQVTTDEAGKPQLRIELKYHDGRPVIRELHRVSTPGRRVYSRIRDLRRVYNGLGISILSTPRGVLSDGEARVANVGGEVLCTVF